MRSFVSFSQFVRHGGQASIVLNLRAAEPVPELKQSPLDSPAADAFEQGLRDLAAENWSGMTAAIARAGTEADPAAEDIEAELARAGATFSEQASANLATADPSVADADISTLAEWLAHPDCGRAMQSSPCARPRHDTMACLGCVVPMSAPTFRDASLNWKRKAAARSATKGR